MAKKIAYFLALILFVSALDYSVAQAQQKFFTGCVNRRPDGTLQLGESPSGSIFPLRGNINLLEENVNHLVRVYGHTQATGKQKPAVLAVDTVQSIAESCTKALPAKNPEPVAGKVGEDMIAVSVTTTKAADQTTAGSQTETAIAQEPGTMNPSHYELRASGKSPYAPAQPEQVAQSEAAADINAQAAERAEILPGKTRGVSNAGGKPSENPDLRFPR